MTAKIKVTQPLRDAAGHEFVQRQVSTGDYNKDIISMEDFKRNPDLYEVAESTSTSKAILAERIGCNESVRRKQVSLDLTKDPRHTKAYAKGLADHNARVAEAKRRNVSLDVVVKEAEQKAFQGRIAAGFKALGFTDAEAKVAAVENRDDLQTAWEILLGKDRAEIARKL